MQSNFHDALQKVLHHEGGFVNHPKDPGGATNLGVTKRVWEEWTRHKCDVEDIKKLTPEDVTPLYKKKYWDIAGCDSLPAGVDYVVFDFAVNAGPGRAVKTLQAAVGATPDGALGPKTLAAVSALGADEVVKRFSQERENFYRSLPTFDVFGKGWLRRIAESKEAGLTMSA